MRRDFFTVEYGTGYIFDELKLILLSKKFEIEKKEIIIDDLIKGVDYKDEDDILALVENALGHKVNLSFNEVIGMKANGKYDLELQKEYMDKSFTYRRYMERGYKFRSLDIGKRYIENCRKSLSEEYDPITLKLILTTSFGAKLGEFIEKQGCKVESREENYREEGNFTGEYENNNLLEYPFKKVDFKSLTIALMEWESKYINWNGYFSSLFKLFDKDGQVKKIEKSQYELKDYITRFLKGDNYLFIPIIKGYKGRYTSITGEYFLYKEDTLGLHKIARSKENHLYDAKRWNSYDIVSEEPMEIGYLLSYSDDIVRMSLGIYRDNLERVLIVNKSDNMAKELCEEFYSYCENISEIEKI